MSDVTTNKSEVSGTVKWEPRVFAPREEGQKTIVSFAIEWQRPKSEKKSVFHIKAFGDLAEKLVEDSLSQGDSIVAEGSLNETNWKDKKTDEWKTQIEVWANKVEFIDRANGGDFGGTDAGKSGYEEDADLPF